MYSMPGKSLTRQVAIIKVYDHIKYRSNESPKKSEVFSVKKACEWRKKKSFKSDFENHFKFKRKMVKTVYEHFRQFQNISLQRKKKKVVRYRIFDLNLF